MVVNHHPHSSRVRGVFFLRRTSADGSVCRLKVTTARHVAQTLGETGHAGRGTRGGGGGGEEEGRVCVE